MKKKQTQKARKHSNVVQKSGEENCMRKARKSKEKKSLHILLCCASRCTQFRSELEARRISLHRKRVWIRLQCEKREKRKKREKKKSNKSSIVVFQVLQLFFHCYSNEMGTRRLLQNEIKFIPIINLQWIMRQQNVDEMEMESEFKGHTN